MISVSESNINIKGHVEDSLVVRRLENDGVIEFGSCRESPFGKRSFMIQPANAMLGRD